MIDTLIHARWIIPVDPEFSQLEYHSIAIHNGRILEVLPSNQAKEKYQARHVYEKLQHALIPGLINAHTHIAMSMFRGIADDLPLMTWLNDHIWPAENRHVNPEFMRLGTRLGIAEMLKCGTTCFNDMYFFPDEVAQLASGLGMRAAIGLIFIDFPSVWAESADEYISKGLDLSDEYRDNPLVSTIFAPHAPYTVSDENLRRIAGLANETDKSVHIHLHETSAEIDQSIEQYGKRPLQRLNELGLVTPSLIAVHMTQVNDQDIEILKNNSVSVVHCPESNLKLASGFCPVGKLQEHSINVALGTDGAASNNDMDIIAEMRTAALLAKAVHADATALAARDAIRMATINGAKALNLADEVGSLETGKWADICCINLNQINTQPVYSPLSQIVYACNSRQVSDVWVAGTQLLNEHRLTHIDEEELISDIHAYQAAH